MNEAIRIEAGTVTFGLGTKWVYTLGAGSIVEFRYIDWTNNRARVTFGHNEAWVSLDDATPVEWDAVNKRWIEA